MQFFKFKDTYSK